MKNKISKTRIEKRMKSKKNSLLVSTILKLKKTNPVVALELAKPKRRWPAVNLKEIDMVNGDVLVAGKILSGGDLSASKKLVSWSVSQKALEKIRGSKSNYTSIIEEIKKNPELNGLKIVR